MFNFLQILIGTSIKLQTNTAAADLSPVAGKFNLTLSFEMTHSSLHSSLIWFPSSTDFVLSYFYVTAQIFVQNLYVFIS